VLDDVGEVDAPSIDLQLIERAIEDRAGRANERLTGTILFVPRLFSDQHQSRSRPSCAEHGLCRSLV
jgi:hypothetical protein